MPAVGGEVRIPEARHARLIATRESCNLPLHLSGHLLRNQTQARHVGRGIVKVSAVWRFPQYGETSWRVTFTRNDASRSGRGIYTNDAGAAFQFVPRSKEGLSVTRPHERTKPVELWAYIAEPRAVGPKDAD